MDVERRPSHTAAHTEELISKWLKTKLAHVQNETCIKDARVNKFGKVDNVQNHNVGEHGQNYFPRDLKSSTSVFPDQNRELLCKSHTYALQWSQIRITGQMPVCGPHVPDPVHIIVVLSQAQVRTVKVLGSTYSLLLPLA